MTHIDHLSVSALFAQHVILQLAEGIRHLCKRRAITKGTWFALERGLVRHWSEDNGRAQDSGASHR